MRPTQNFFFLYPQENIKNTNDSFQTAGADTYDKLEL